MAIETADAVNACGTVKACRVNTIVNVYAAIRPFPAVDTDARIAAVRIGAGGTVLADGRSQGTFVNVFFAKFTGIVGRTFAAIRIHGIDAGAAVLAMMAGAIVDVLLTVDALKACDVHDKPKKKRFDNDSMLNSIFIKLIAIERELNFIIKRDARDIIWLGLRMR